MKEQVENKKPLAFLVIDVLDKYNNNQPKTIVIVMSTPWDIRHTGVIPSKPYIWLVCG